MEMKIGLFSGILVALFMITLSQSVNDYAWLVLVSGGSGTGALVLSGMLTARQKGETTGKSDGKDEYAGWISNLFFFALPNLAAACTGWFFM
jgi:hypothetical protein